MLGYGLVNLLEVDVEFCANTAVIWHLVGQILTIIKIVFPLLVIIFGIVDIGKSVVASKPEEITKSFKSFLYRLAAAIAIFFIPNIVGFGISLANGFSEVESDYKICRTCIVTPSSCDTSREEK